MNKLCSLIFCVPLLLPGVRAAQASATPEAVTPYDFTAATTLLEAEHEHLDGHVAVLVRQDGTELYRYQAGDIDYDTKTRLASLTKTISAGVILALCDTGVLALEDRLGDDLPRFEAAGLGDPTILDAWSMRHGIEAPRPYEWLPRFNLSRSVAKIAVTGELVFPPGTKLGYSGTAMQATGQLAAQRTGHAWERIAAERILRPCGMSGTDYGQFRSNPAIAGGARGSADELIGYAQVILDRGRIDERRVLSEASIEELFTNRTRGLPVHFSPWPSSHPRYPYGADPDYGFGTWVLAEHPETQHVEEIVGAGAWGSYLWIDRRRGLTAVLITDVRPGSRASIDAALGLFAIARHEVESAQVRNATAKDDGDGVRLAWRQVPGSVATRVYGAKMPIRDVFALREAELLTETADDEALVPGFDHYAVTAVFPSLENTALVPGGNAVARRTKDEK